MSRARQADVLIRNEAFYTAFTTRDLSTMKNLWATETHVICIHPGDTPLLGRDAVIESWARILSSPVRYSLQCLEPKVYFVNQDLAIVVCFERYGPETLAATNIFAFESDDWMLIHHQSGPIAPDVSALADIPQPRLLQ
ncbi:MULTISPECIES: nuclear transport factor 2 family protein [Alphaproteobacteria]|uniref:nuclear transport factor 2 family protein n=1 Tax=Alphaproteobacteria TaxID=28211 RepID=UPI003263C73B